MFTKEISLNGDNTADPEPGIIERIMCRVDFMALSAFTLIDVSLNDYNSAAGSALGYAFANAAYRTYEDLKLKNIFGVDYKDLKIEKSPPKAGSKKYSNEVFTARMISGAENLAGIAALATYFFVIKKLGLSEASESFFWGAMMTGLIKKDSFSFRFEKVVLEKRSISNDPPKYRETASQKAIDFLQGDLKPALALTYQEPSPQDL